MIGREVEETNLKNYNYYLANKNRVFYSMHFKNLSSETNGAWHNQIEKKSAFDSEDFTTKQRISLLYIFYNLSFDGIFFCSI